MFGYDTHHEIDPSGYTIIEFDTTDIDRIYYNINTRIEKLNNEGTFPVRLRFVTRNGIGIINFNDMAVISIYFLRVTLVENKNDAEPDAHGQLRRSRSQPDACSVLRTLSLDAAEDSRWTGKPDRKYVGP